jgi:hypothetical protein
MKLSLFKRVKQHDFPGDVPKSVKIAMREGKRIDEPNRSKTYRKVVNMRTRATLKRNMQKEIQMELFNPEVAEALEKEIGRILNEEYLGTCTLTHIALHLATWCHKNNVTTKNIMEDVISIITNEDTKNIEYAYHSYNHKLHMVVMWCDDELNFHDELSY